MICNLSIYFFQRIFYHMKTFNFKYLLTLLLVFFLLESCNTDDDYGNTSKNEPSVTDITTQLVIDWNDFWLGLDVYAFGMRPNATARALAYIHLAAYEKEVDDMTGFTSNTSRLQNLIIDGSQRGNTIDLNIPLNTCYAALMDHFIYNISSEMDGEVELFKITKENLSYRMFQIK